MIYALDCRGLQTGRFQAADNIKNQNQDVIKDRAQDRTDFLRDTQEAMAYLSDQTGGFAVLNTNDLALGLARIADDVRDYLRDRIHATGRHFREAG